MIRSTSFQVLMRFALAGVLGAAGPAAPPEPSTGQIHGIVRINGAAPARYANVVLVDAGLGAQADEHGFFRIARVPRGTHAIRACLVGLPCLSDTVEAAAGVDRELDLDLLNPLLLEGAPRAPFAVFNLGDDFRAGTVLVEHRRPPVQTSSAENRSGRFELRVDERRPWELRIGYRLTNRAARLSIRVFDPDGKLVRTLRDGRGRAVGDLTWDGRGSDSKPMDSGRCHVQFSTDSSVSELSACVYPILDPPLRVTDEQARGPGDRSPGPRLIAPAANGARRPPPPAAPPCPVRGRPRSARAARGRSA